MGMRRHRVAWLTVGLLLAGFAAWNVAGAATPLTPAAGELDAVAATDIQPVLVIRSPRPGQTVTPPWPVRYVITGLKVGPARPVVILVGLVGLNRTLQLTATRQSGVVKVPDDRFFSGRRDVVFTLVDGAGEAYSNRGASYVVKNLIIAGNR
jgi:hypothetical protein